MCPNSTYWEADLRFHGPKYGLGNGGRERKGGRLSLNIFMSINGSSGIAWWQMTPLIVNVEKVYGQICGNQIHLFRIAV